MRSSWLWIAAALAATACTTGMGGADGGAGDGSISPIVDGGSSWPSPAWGTTAHALRDSSRHLLHMSKSQPGQFHENHSPYARQSRSQESQ